MDEEWFSVRNISEIDSPSLLVYPDRIKENVDLVIRMAGDAGRLRPHVKTFKMEEPCEMMIRAGIRKFKCATIAEAEMLGQIGAPDVLLAYQPVPPRIHRLLQLAEAYPGTHYSCLTDNIKTGKEIDIACAAVSGTLSLYLDLNVGMDRTGVKPSDAFGLAKDLRELKNVKITGLHAYDGHIHDTDTDSRRQKADASYKMTKQVYDEISPLFDYPLTMVIGGTPTFPVHIRREECECSPGTFVFWDWGYKEMLPDLPFKWAALVLARVLSVIDRRHICIDLGYKAVASESPLPRVWFINAPDAKPEAQSEEHLVLAVPDSNIYNVGDALYGVPLHICPTVAMYDRAYTVFSHEVTGYWQIKARNRYINY